MDKQIEIKYPSGHMVLNLERFFPTTVKDCKQVLKTIQLDWRHRDELVETIIDWMKEEQDQCNDNSKICANSYIDVKPKVKEAEVKYLGLKISLDKNKMWKEVCPAEYKVLKEKMSKANDEYKHLKKLAQSYHSSFNMYNIRKEKLQKNIEFYEKG